MILESGRSPGEWSGYLLQLSWLEMQETWVLSLGWEDPLEKGMQPTPVFLPGESPWPEEPVGCSPWGFKESDTTERLSTGLKVYLQGKRKKEFISYLWAKGGKTLFASSQFSLVQNNLYVKETFFKMTYSDFLQWI